MMKNAVEMVRRFLKDEKGTEIVEWAIVGGLVVAVGAAIFVGIGDNASGALTSLADQVAAANK